MLQLFWWSMELGGNLSQSLDQQQLQRANASQAAREVHRRLCDVDPESEFLRLQTWNLTQDLVGRLCNLSQSQFQLLVEDVVADLDWRRLVQQV